MLIARILLLLPAFVLSIVNYGPTPAPHILDDGFVERSLSIVIRGTSAHCEYRIGLNNNTMSELVSKWSAADTIGSETDNKKTNAQNANPTNGASVESENKLADSTRLKPSNVKNFSILSEQPDRSTESQVLQSQSNPSALPLQENTTSAGPQSEKNPEVAHWLNPQLFKKFESLAIKQIPSHLDVKIDGQAVPIMAVAIGPPSRHPFYLTLKFEIAVPDSRSFQLIVKDKCFQENTGAVRYSLKSRGQAMVLQSNVAPTIIRAKRVDLEGLSTESRELQTTISSRIGVASRKGSPK